MCIGSQLFARVLHVRSIHSAEKGEKGQVVVASEGRWGNGKTLETAAAFRNVTFPFCRLPPDRSSFFASSPSSPEPFGQTRTIPPRIRRPRRAPDCSVSSFVSFRGPSTRATLSLYPFRDVTIIRGASESPGSRETNWIA